MANNTNENVAIPRAEFEELMKGMKALQAEIVTLKKGGTEQKVARKPKENIVRITFINGMPVIGYVNRGSKEKPTYIYELANPMKPNEYVLQVDVILKGETKPLRVAYLELLEQGERHECVVLEVKKEKWENVEGTVTRKSVPDGEYYLDDTGIVVPVVNEGFVCTYKVRLPNGESLDIHERYVNIV